MIRSQMLITGAAVGLTMTVAGCDPIVCVGQEVVIMVTDAASGEPIPNARVLAEHELGLLSSNLGTTDDQDEPGQAMLVMGMCLFGDPEATCVSDPSLCVDHVTGELFSFDVITDEVREVLTGEVNPGQTIQGDAFAVTVNSVGETTTRPP